jgi:hypothetical protein
MLRTMTATLTQSAANAYVEKEFKFPSKSRITILRADIVIGSHVILDGDFIQLGIAKGAISAITLPTDNQCIWYKEYLQVGAQAGGVDLSWLVQNLPSFTNDKFTVWLDTDSYAALTLTAYFTLLVDIKPIRGI